MSAAAITIRAAVTETPGAPMRLEELRMDPPGPGQVRVRVAACGVCHTDMVMRDGALPVPFPVVLGHEGAGTVEAVGPGVTAVSPGDAVLMSFASCGACPSCHATQPGYCIEFFPRNFLGVVPEGQGGLWRGDQRIGSEIFGQSAFATYALAHERNVVKLDPGMPLEVLAPLGCSVQTGAGTVLRSVGLRPGESAAIFGAGAVGLSAVMAARIAGAVRILVLDRHHARLELAKELGATEVVTAPEDIMGLFDCVIDTTGVASLLEPAVAMLAQRGTLALVGAYPPDAVLPLDCAAVMSMGRKIVGIVEGGVDPQQFLPELLAHYRAGRLPLEKLVKTYPFVQIEQAIHASETGEVIKPVLVMEDA